MGAGDIGWLEAERNLYFRSAEDECCTTWDVNGLNIAARSICRNDVCGSPLRLGTDVSVFMGNEFQRLSPAFVMLRRKRLLRQTAAYLRSLQSFQRKTSADENLQLCEPTVTNTDSIDAA